MKGDKLIIFDLDGTLFRTDIIDNIAVNKALVKNSLKVISRQQIVDLIGEPIDIFINKLNVTDDEGVKKKLANDIAEAEIELIPQHGELFPHVLPVLKNLKKKGHTICICSNCNEHYLKEISIKFKLVDIFDEIACTKALGFSDKKDAVRYLKEKYNKEVSIVVGDREIDFKAARDNECFSIAAVYGFAKESEIKLANYRLESLIDLERIIECI